MSDETPSGRGQPSGWPTLELVAARYGPAAAIAIVGLALVLRLRDMLGWWVNPDEGIYYAAITQESLRLFLSEAFATAHPPLYFLILRAMAWIGTDLFWLRSLALVSGCAAVWVFVLVGRDIGGPSARGWLMGLASGLLLAVSPEAIAASQVIRPYMTLVLLLALMVHFLLRHLERPSSGALIGYAVCASLAALLHYSAVFAFAVLGTWLAADGIARGTGRREWRRLVAIQAVPGAIVAVLYVVHLRQLMGSADPEFSVTVWLSEYLIRAPSDAWLSLVGFHAGLVGPAASASATLLTLLAIVVAVTQREYALYVPVAGALAVATAAAALELYPFGGARHSAWLLPFVTPGLAWIVVSSVPASPKRSYGRVALVVSVAVAGLVLRAPLGAERVAPALPEHSLRTEHLEAMADVLDPRGTPRLIVMSVETYRMLVPLYARERLYARASADGSYLHFRWGERDVLVLPTLEIAVRRDQTAQPNHLLTGTRRAAAALGVALPENGEPLLVLSGAWRRIVFDLVALAREEGLTGETRAVPGLVGITLDLGAYGRALEGGA